MWPPVPGCRRAALHGRSTSPSSLRGRSPSIRRRPGSSFKARAAQLSRGGLERPRSPRPGRGSSSVASPAPGLLASFSCLAAGAPGRGKNGMGTRHPAPAFQGSRPGSSPPQGHPGLTKKRVELVPWSTAPTNGPKTAFFAAAMKPAWGRQAVAARFPGDGGGRGRGGLRVGRSGWPAAVDGSDRARAAP